MVVRWKFFDGVTEVEFPINPSEGGSPQYEKNFVFEDTSAPEGKTLVFEGRDSPKPLNFSGVILTEAHYDFMIEWWDKRNQVRITDDLGREFWVIIKSFRPKRERAHSYPWKHSFDVEAVIVDW